MMQRSLVASKRNVGEYYGHFDHVETAPHARAVTQARALDTRAAGPLSGRVTAPTARIHLRALTLLPEVPPGPVRSSTERVAGAHQSDDDGALRRLGDRSVAAPGSDTRLRGARGGRPALPEPLLG